MCVPAEMDLLRQTENINQLLARYGVKFSIYKNQEFKEQLFPFDAIPRIIKADEFAWLERGLKQRAMALNRFLGDIYGEKKIIRDQVVPEDFAFLSKGYMAECDGILPPKGIYNHISGIDLVKGKDGNWYVLEDNLCVPSGASYPLIAREICRICCPETFRDIQIDDNRNYAELLAHTMNHVNCGGLSVVLTPGRFNAAYFEHSYLAEKTGAKLVSGQDLLVENNVVYYKNYDGGREKVGTVYRRLSDEYLDPMNFYRESYIGVPHLYDAFRAGNVAIINAIGNGAADDKGIYYFVPKMIRYYLGEEPILQNAPQRHCLRLCRAADPGEGEGLGAGEGAEVSAGRQSGGGIFYLRLKRSRKLRRKKPGAHASGRKEKMDLTGVFLRNE